MDFCQMMSEFKTDIQALVSRTEHIEHNIADFAKSHNLLIYSHSALEEEVHRLANKVLDPQDSQTLQPSPSNPQGHCCPNIFLPCKGRNPKGLAEPTRFTREILEPLHVSRLICCHHAEEEGIFIIHEDP